MQKMWDAAQPATLPNLYRVMCNGEHRCPTCKGTGVFGPYDRKCERGHKDTTQNDCRFVESFGHVLYVDIEFQPNHSIPGVIKVTFTMHNGYIKSDLFFWKYWKVHDWRQIASV